MTQTIPTPTLNRRHFEFVAELIGTGAARVGIEPGVLDQLSEFACSRLASTNPAFKRATFRCALADRYDEERAAIVERAENDDDYNGWTNWDTWTVNLEMTNEAGLYERYAEMGRAPDVEAALRDIQTAGYVRADVDWDLVDWEELAEAARECAGVEDDS